jgi:nucleoside-diphosphate-sugar epimerase
VADALDPNAVAQAVASAEPEVIVHELTALSGSMSVRDMRHPERPSLGIMTNRVRTEATDHLLAAGRAVGARRFVAQSFAAFRWARIGGPVLTEDDPLDTNPPAALRVPLVGILHVERAVPAIEWGEGLVLRYGGFYGPGTAISGAPDAPMAALVRKRRFPILGDGGGVFSHVHIGDAAAATVAAVDRGRPGIYNVVDDAPAPAREWLPVLASVLDAKPPRHIPRWLGRLAAEAPVARYSSMSSSQTTALLSRTPAADIIPPSDGHEREFHGTSPITGRNQSMAASSRHKSPSLRAGRRAAGSAGSGRPCGATWKRGRYGAEENTLRRLQPDPGARRITTRSGRSKSPSGSAHVRADQAATRTRSR